MSCLIHARYNMTADVLGHTPTQSPSGAIERDYNLVTTIKCIARGISGGGIRVVGSTERWDDQYENVEWIKIQTDYHFSKRDMISNIKDSDGNVIWPEQYEIVGVMPVVDPFGQQVEWDVLARRPQVQK